MSKLVVLLIKWIVQRLAVLVLILAVLLVGVWIKSEWSKLSRTMEEIGRKERFVQSLEGELERLNAEIEKEAGPQREMLSKLASLDGAASSARQAAQIAKFRWDYWRGQVGWYQALMEQWKVAKRETAKAEYWARHGTAVAAEKARDLYAETLKDSRVYQLVKDRNEVETAKRQLAQLIEEEKAAVSNDPKQRLVAAIRSQLPTALWILLGIILTPVLIKAFFYYVLAPLAQLLPPIRILPDSGAPAIPGPVPSAVSLAFEIGDDEEILVHPDFLQSSSLPARKRTQWFLNPRMPFSSIASGMFMLIRIQPEEDRTTKVMVSSQNDAFGEIGMLELPDGAAVVVQPRSLAGIIKRQGDRVFITRHWRLWSLHAWLTLQLRYLAFHGPCKLILKGCRGVRAEEPDPDRPRMINQASTIGFSANLAYKNTRCETFISYLRGKEDLFNDLFAGGPGRFVYEEMPAGGRKTGITGRGLEGLVDATLKLFGV